MASLTHVSRWTAKGWEKVTVEKASELFPNGPVPAYSGLFMCELCGQRVTFTGKGKQARHFRHSRSDQDKDCKERSSGNGSLQSYQPENHDLPIRITEVSSSSFRFEIGLIRAPIDSLDNDFRIEIKPKGTVDTGSTCVFTKERLNYESITYLSIGERPFEKYTLHLKNGNEELHKFWPAEINGIDPKGTLFEKSSGKKLSYDADVEVEKEYYLLKRGDSEPTSYGSVGVKKITRKNFGCDIWTLYVISAPSLSEGAARFFLDFHCRLTEQPVSLQPVWPLFVEGNYLIKHNQDRTYILVDGNIEPPIKSFPNATVRRLNGNIQYPKLYEIHCSSRQQLISAGRARALQYTYFWKEPLNHAGSSPTISVTDLSGSPIASGESNKLPQKKILLFKSPFDGELIISLNHIIDKRKIIANIPLELNQLRYGLTIQAIIGLDVVWEIHFVKQPVRITNDEIELLHQICGLSGALIPAPHSLRNILAGLHYYPQICQWIRRRIKEGTIYEQSYRRLQEIYRRIIMNKQGDQL